MRYLVGKITHTQELFPGYVKGGSDRSVPSALAMQTSKTLLTASEQTQANRSILIFGSEVLDDGATLDKRAYPHLLEAAQPALSLVRQALAESRLALDSYDDGDIDGVSSRLKAIAAQCAKAHHFTEFNESFGSVVSYIRRAALIADASDITRVALNSLIQAINRLTDNPMIPLTVAAEMLTVLSDDGWQGEYQAVERLLSLLLNNDSVELPIESDA